jgi:hypothetical protein
VAHFGPYSSFHPMAATRQMGGCQIGLLDDDEHDDSDTVIILKTAIIEASGRDIHPTLSRRSAPFELLAPDSPTDIHSTSPRRSAPFGLPTPESPTGLRSFDLRPTFPPSSPTPLRGISKGIKPLKSPQEKQSKHSSKESTTSIALPPPAASLTQNNTPPRKTKPIPHNAETRIESESSLLPTPANTPARLLFREEVKVKSELSPSIETAWNVAETLEMYVLFPCYSL